MVNECLQITNDTNYLSNELKMNGLCVSHSLFIPYSRFWFDSCDIAIGVCLSSLSERNGCAVTKTLIVNIFALEF